MAEILTYGLGGKHRCDPVGIWEHLAGGPRPRPGAKLRCDCGQVWGYRLSPALPLNRARGGWTKLREKARQVEGFHHCAPRAAWQRSHPVEHPPIGALYHCRCGKRWRAARSFGEFGPPVDWYEAS